MIKTFLNIDEKNQMNLLQNPESKIQLKLATNSNQFFLEISNQKISRKIDLRNEFETTSIDYLVMSLKDQQGISHLIKVISSILTSNDMTFQLISLNECDCTKRLTIDQDKWLIRLSKNGSDRTKWLKLKINLTFRIDLLSISTKEPSFHFVSSQHRLK